MKNKILKVAFAYLFLTTPLHAQNEDLTLEQFESILSGSEPPKSYEEFLQRLPKVYRSHFHAVKQSTSLQSSTDKEPRILLYGKTARLIMSFNGNPDDTGYNDIEVSWFNPQTLNFEYYSYHPEWGVPLAKRPQANPSECAACHNNGGPIVAFDEWDKSSFNLFARTKAAKNRPQDLKEALGWERYRALDLETMSKRMRQSPQNASHLELGRLLRELSYTRAAAFLTRSKEYPAFKYSIMAALSSCENPRAFFPDSLLNDLVRPLATLKKKTMKELIESQSFRKVEKSAARTERILTTGFSSLTSIVQNYLKAQDMIDFLDPVSATLNCRRNMVQVIEPLLRIDTDLAAAVQKAGLSFQDFVDRLGCGQNEDGSFRAPRPDWKRKFQNHCAALADLSYANVKQRSPASASGRPSYSKESFISE